MGAPLADACGRAAAGRTFPRRGGRPPPRLACAAGGALAAALVALLAAGGCRTPDVAEAPVHVVQPGQTLWRIAHHYGLPLEAVLEANGIEDVHDVAVGTVLRLPGGRPGRGVPLRPPDGGPGRAGEILALDGGLLRFAWPVRGRITSQFGPRGRRRHEGIDIAAPPGTAVRAAERGRVIHAGPLGSYGNLVVLRHDARTETVYAHARRIHVRPRSVVERGQVIAEVGATGNATGPHLHFEVRRDDAPEDPLRYLP